MLHGSRSGFRRSSTSCRHGGVRFDRYGGAEPAPRVYCVSGSRCGRRYGASGVRLVRRRYRHRGGAVAVGHADRALPMHVVVLLFVAPGGFALILDRITRPVEAAFKVT